MGGGGGRRVLLTTCSVAWLLYNIYTYTPCTEHLHMKKLIHIVTDKYLKITLRLYYSPNTLTSTICRTCLETVSASNELCLPAAHSENFGSWSTMDALVRVVVSRDLGSLANDSSSNASSSILL